MTRSQSRLHRSVRAVGVLVCTSAFLYSAAIAEADEDRTFFKSGVAAAKRGDYPEALRLFGEARAEEPNASDIYYNLGLTESMMNGRELRAIAWFGAYLAAEPGAANAVTVKARMAALKAKSENTIRTFMQLSEDTAKEFTHPYYYDNSLFRTAVLCAEVGDAEALERIEGLIADPPQKSFTLHELLNLHLRNGDIAAAKEVFTRIQDSDTRNQAQLEIADVELKAGELDNARQTLTAALESPGSAEDACYKSTVLTRIAEVQIKQNDIAGAKQTLAEAKQNIASFDRYSTIKAQCLVAEAEVHAGDIAAAEATFAAAHLYAGATQWALLTIAEARARTGNIAEAIRITDSIVNPTDAGKDVTGMVIIAEQLKSDDLEGAQSTADKMGSAYYRNRAALLIHDAKMKLVMSSSYWLSLLDDPDTLGDTMFLDLKEEMKKLSLVEDPTTGFEGVLGRARIYFEAHQTVSGMVEILEAQQ